MFCTALLVLISVSAFICTPAASPFYGNEPPSTPERRSTPDDGKIRQLLREKAPQFLAASPGRDLPMDASYSTLRFDIWPKVAARCEAAESEAGMQLPTPSLLAIVVDEAEESRAREMALWLLAARVIKKEDGGRPAAAQQLLPINREGVPRLPEIVGTFLQSSDRVTRSSAVVVIGEHGAPDSAPALVQAIKGPFLPERVAACRAIGRFGVEGLGVEGIGLYRPLIFDRPELATTQAATKALLIAGTVEFERHGTTTAIDELIRALRYAPHAGTPRDRKHWGSWERQPGDDELVIGFTDDEIASGARSDAFIRTAASWQLAHVDIYELQQRVFEPMLASLRDNEVAVVDSAYRFLDRVGVQAAEWNAGPVLEQLMRAEDEMLSSRAVWVFAHWGERIRPYLAQIIEHTDANIAADRGIFYNIWALGNSGHPDAEEYLRRLRPRIGPETRPMDDQGRPFNNDKQLTKLVDEGLARLAAVRALKYGATAAAQDQGLTDALAQPRRRYLTPTLLAIMNDASRNEALRVRCAEVIRDLEPVAAPVWFAQSLQSRNVPAALRAVLERDRPPRKEDE